VKELQFTRYENASDKFVAQALQAPETKWYLAFARHPWIISERRGDWQVVEWRDLQFSFDKTMLQGLDISERQSPFVLRYSISLNDGSVEIVFNGKLTRCNESKEPAASAP
jgi:hypothetical protein